MEANMKNRSLCVVVAMVLGILALGSICFAAAATSSAPNWWVGPPAEFQKLVEGAEKEGEVILWDSSGALFGKALLEAWPKQWKIKLNSIGVDHEQQVTRVLTEARGGLNTVDVINPSLVGVHLLYERGILARLVPENVRVLRDVPKLVTKVSGVPVGWNPRYGVRVFTYNTEKVKDPPKDWPDLLDPKWKGRIAFDMDMRQVLPLACSDGERVGWGYERVRDFLRQLAKQKPQYHDQGRVMATWVGSGKADILAGGAFSHALVLKKQGAPVNAVLPRIIGKSENLMAVPEKAPHPNAARLLMAWVLSPESLRSLWNVGYYGNIFISPEYYGDPSFSFYYDLGKGKTVVDASVDCVQKAEKENWVGIFRKDIGFE